jgi:hypothetical protein
MVQPRGKVTGDYIERICLRESEEAPRTPATKPTLELPGSFGSQLIVNELAHRQDGVTSQTLARRELTVKGCG